MSFEEETDMSGAVIAVILVICFSIITIGIALLTADSVKNINNLNDDITRIRQMTCDEVKDFILYEYELDESLQYTPIVNAMNKQYKKECLGIAIPDEPSRSLPSMGIRNQ